MFKVLGVTGLGLVEFLGLGFLGFQGLGLKVLGFPYGRSKKSCMTLNTPHLGKDDTIVY